MSSSLFIPYKYVVTHDEDGNKKLIDKISVDLDLEQRETFVKGEPVKYNPLKLYYVLEVEIQGELRRLELHPIYLRVGVCDEEFIGFQYTGFYSTCEELIGILNLPPEIDIF